MEPDLDRLLDFESRGGLFPQFERESWSVRMAAAEAIARAAESMGGRRARVAVQIATPQSFSALFIAFARSSADLFLFNPTWGKAEMDTALRIAQPHLLVREGASQLFEYEANAKAPAGESVESGRNKLRIMIPTGGTTGRIRFAIHDWSTLAAATYGFQQHVGCGSMATHCVLPLYHVSGFMQLVRALLTMGKIVYGTLDAFAANHVFLAEERRENRFLSLVGTQLGRLVRDPDSHRLLREYGSVFVGGGPVSIGLLDQCRSLKLPLAPTYGMTETAAQVATLLPSAFLAGENSQGRVLPHVALSIVKEESPSELCETGVAGRIRIGGSSLFRGYYGDDVSLASSTILTSDLGYLDPSGRLYVLGRADRVIISGGEKVNLRQVEIAAEQSGLVADAIAFGVEDREWGEKLVLAYVPTDDVVSESALKEALKLELSDFKVPKTWIRIDAIPRNEAGKPMLAALKLAN